MAQISQLEEKVKEERAKLQNLRKSSSETDKKVSLEKSDMKEKSGSKDKKKRKSVLRRDEEKKEETEDDDEEEEEEGQNESDYSLEQNKGKGKKMQGNIAKPQKPQQQQGPVLEIKRELAGKIAPEAKKSDKPSVSAAKDEKKPAGKARPDDFGPEIPPVSLLFLRCVILFF